MHLGHWDLGPFDNDDAQDLVRDLLDGEDSPSRLLKDALRDVERPGYLQVDGVARAWAACALVAIVVTGGAGVDVESELYEAAARVQPTATLIRSCLAAIPHLLAPRSELAGLLTDARALAQVASDVDRVRAELEAALSGPLKRLPKPKITTVQVFAFPLSGANRWAAYCEERHGIAVFDGVWSAPPDPLDVVGREVLFRCVLFGSRGSAVARGRAPIGPSLQRPWAAASFVDGGGVFDHYLREDAKRRLKPLTYAEASVLPWHRWLEAEEVAAAVEQHIDTGAIPMLRLPSPAERAEMHVERSLSLMFVGARLTGVGPPPRPGRPLVERGVDGPAILAAAVREGRITERAASAGLADNDSAWMLGTLVAAASLPDGGVALPDGFAEYVAALRPVVGPAEVRAARAALTAITQTTSAAMKRRAGHPEPQRRFLEDVQRTLHLLSE